MADSRITSYRNNASDRVEVTMNVSNCSALNFQKDGVEVLKALLAGDVIDAIKSDIDLESDKLRKYGIRNLEKRFSSIAQLANDSRLLALAGKFLGGNARVVRALFFDKTLAKNWFVAWHQDRMVTLNERIEATGWGPWSVKDGVCHVQPPVAVLDSMVTFRFHLDAANEENGCLEVIPGSHKDGILGQPEIDESVRNGVTVHCAVDAGDAVVMRPLMLHRSIRAAKPSHRRVVHLEFSSFELPKGVSWA